MRLAKTSLTSMFDIFDTASCTKFWGLVAPDVLFGGSNLKGLRGGGDNSCFVELGQGSGCSLCLI